MQRGLSYSRRISSEEAREGYILVLKDRLPFFPPLGQSFSVRKDGGGGKAKVESYPCTCRGPDLPHEHYFIRWRGLRPNDKVEIKRNPRGQRNSYVIRIKR